MVLPPRMDDRPAFDPTTMKSSQVTVSDGQTSFSDVYLATAACLRNVQLNVPSLRHVSWEKIVQFGMDISIVACGIRCSSTFAIVL